jgi:hypothetical protein
MRLVVLLLVAAGCSSGTTTAPPPNIVCNVDSLLCACSIDVSVAESTTGCSPSDVGAGAVCCASSGFPSSGSCACTAIRCFAKTDGSCYCSDAQANPTDTSIDTCQSPAGGHCCLDKPNGFCGCGTVITCSAASTTVSSCDVPSTTPPCANTDHQVAKCK